MHIKNNILTITILLLITALSHLSTAQQNPESPIRSAVPGFSHVAGQDSLEVHITLYIDHTNFKTIDLRYGTAEKSGDISSAYLTLHKTNTGDLLIDNNQKEYTIKNGAVTITATTWPEAKNTKQTFMTLWVKNEKNELLQNYIKEHNQ